MIIFLWSLTNFAASLLVNCSSLSLKAIASCTTLLSGFLPSAIRLFRVSDLICKHSVSLKIISSLKPRFMDISFVIRVNLQSLSAFLFQHWSCLLKSCPSNNLEVKAVCLLRPVLAARRFQPRPSLPLVSGMREFFFFQRCPQHYFLGLKCSNSPKIKSNI